MTAVGLQFEVAFAHVGLCWIGVGVYRGSVGLVEDDIDDGPAS